MYSQKLFNTLFTHYNLRNRAFFIRNFLYHLILINNNSITNEIGYEYIIIYYNNLFSIFKDNPIVSTFKTLTDRFIQTSIVLQPVPYQDVPHLIDIIEEILSLQIEITLDVISSYQLDIRIDIYNNIYINGITSSSLILTLKILLAHLAYTINNADSIYSYNNYYLVYY